MRNESLRNNNTAKLLMLSFGAFLMLTVKGLSQTTAYYFVRSTDTIFNISAKTSGLDSFYFPQVGESPELYSGYKVDDQRSEFVLNKFQSMTPSDEVSFKARVYCTNIKTIIFSFKGAVGKGPVEFHINRSGYQVPLSNALSVSDSSKFSTDSIVVSVSYEKISPQQESSLIVGNMIIAGEHLNKFLSPTRIFQRPPFDNNKMGVQYITTKFDSYGFYKHFPDGEIEENFKGSLYVEDTIKETNLLLRNIFVSLIENYPFYNERKLNKKNSIQKAAKVAELYPNLATCDYAKEINRYLNTEIKDPHFFVDCKFKKEQKLITPVYVYEIDGLYRVSAVLDDSLKNSIPLGSEILKIDDVNLKEHIDDIPAINQYLKKEPGRTVALLLKLPSGKLDSVSYKLKDRYNVPSTFRPSNLFSKYLNDTTIYYKINHIDAELALDFVSKLDVINKRKKIILDFRGCGGGDFIAGAQFLSYFINGPFRYFDYQSLNAPYKDSVIVRANHTPFHFRQDGRIVILADNNTACVAELMIYRLRNAGPLNVSVIAKENTKGALAILCEIMLPGNVVSIGTNALNTGKLMLDGKSIENVGIRPDILIKINTVTDLQPYDDKVLQTAILN